MTLSEEPLSEGILFEEPLSEGILPEVTLCLMSLCPRGFCPK